VFAIWFAFFWVAVAILRTSDDALETGGQSGTRCLRRKIRPLMVALVIGAGPRLAVGRNRALGEPTGGYEVAGL
jgi:hypothetical protein